MNNIINTSSASSDDTFFSLDHTESPASTHAFHSVPSEAFMEPEGGAWQRIVRWWHGSYPLENEIQAIAEKIKSPEASDKAETVVSLFPKDQNILDLVEIIVLFSKHQGERQWSRTGHALKRIISELDNAKLNDLLFAVAERRLGDGGHSKKNSLLDTALSLLTLHRMQTLLAYKHEQIANTKKSVEQLRDMAADVANFLHREEDKRLRDGVNSAAMGVVNKASNFFHSFLAAFFKAHDFSLEDEPPFDRAEANDRLTNIYELIEKPLRVVAIILAVAAILFPTNWVPILVTGGVVLLTVIGLALLNRHHQKTLPVQLSNGFSNLTRSAERGELPPVIGRHTEVAGIVDCLGNLDRNSRKPLLVGPSGVGKTEIVNRLAQEIADGKHPQLSGKQIYSINTAALLDTGLLRGGHAYTRLQVLLKEIEGREDDVILFFDEVHSIFGTGSSKGAQGLAQQFKILLDNPKIHCIAATTDTDFDSTIGQDAALARRFRKINVAALARPDCEIMLRDILRRDYPEVTISDQAIAAALDLTDSADPTVAQPAKAKDLIIEAVQAIRRYEGPERAQLKRVKDEYDRARAELKQHDRVAATAASMQERLAILRQLKQRVDELQSRIDEKNRQIQELETLKVERKAWRQKYINYAHDLQELEEQDVAIEPLGKAFLFLGDYILDACESQIIRREAELRAQGMPSRIDVEVITKLFRDKQEGGFGHLADHLRGLWGADAQPDLRSREVLHPGDKEVT